LARHGAEVKRRPSCEKRRPKSFLFSADQMNKHNHIGFDPNHESALIDAFTKALVEASMIDVAGSKVLCIRTGEAASALTIILAGVLAISPPGARTEAALKKIEREFGKLLRRRVAAATDDPEYHAFYERAFHVGEDDDGNRGGRA
jgi:hypothetical protein